MNPRVAEKTRVASSRTRQKLEQAIAEADGKMAALLDHDRSLDFLESNTKCWIEKLDEAVRAMEGLADTLPSVTKLDEAAREFAKWAMANGGVTFFVSLVRNRPTMLVENFVIASHRTKILTQFDAELTDELFERLQDSLSKRAEDLKEIGLFVAVQDAVAAEKKRRAERKY